MKKNRWIYWLKLIAGLVLVGIIYQKINQRESIIEAFRVTDWLNIGLCALLLIPNILLSFLKWRYLLKKRFADIPGREVFGSLLFGYTLGLITPGRLGELARGLFFHNKNKILVTGLNLIDKAANQIVFFTFGGIALVLMIESRRILDPETLAPVLIAGAVVLLTLWFVVINPPMIKKLLHRIGRRFAAGSKIHPLISTFDNFTLRDSMAVMGFSLVWVGVITYQYHILVLAFTGVSLWESFQAVSAALFVKTLLPITFGDLGIREGISVFFYSQFQVSPAAVFNASLLIFLINFLTPALCGIYYVFQVREIKNGRARIAAGELARDHHNYPTLAESNVSDD